MPYYGHRMFVSRPPPLLPLLFWCNVLSLVLSDRSVWSGCPLCHGEFALFRFFLPHGVNVLRPPCVFGQACGYILRL